MELEVIDHENNGNSSSSSDDSSSSTAEDHVPIQNDDNNATPEQLQVEKWTRQIPIGLGLCPWAAKSHNQGNLRYVTCTSETPQGVAVFVQQEVERLISTNHNDLQWSTTLVVCPFVSEWNESFATFDRFVSNGIGNGIEQEDNDEDNTSITDEITLVAFHPDFNRWYSLPENVSIGSTVQAHHRYLGKKSVESAAATILETCNKAFGMRKVKVRFHDIQSSDGARCFPRRREEYVPTDWISVDPDTIQKDDERGNEVCNGKPSPASSHDRHVLPDNAMHQAPHPTIHIISNTDLARLSIRDISRVKRKNAHRMMKLGWDGVEKKLSLING